MIFLDQLVDWFHFQCGSRFDSTPWCHGAGVHWSICGWRVPICFPFQAWQVAHDPNPDMESQGPLVKLVKFLLNEIPLDLLSDLGMPDIVQDGD